MKDKESRKQNKIPALRASSLFDRLEYCRKMLFLQDLIAEKQNEKLRSKIRTI